MVHFLRRRDSNNSTKDANSKKKNANSSSNDNGETTATATTSNNNFLTGLTFKDQKVLLEYMVEKLPKMESLDPAKFFWNTDNPCAAVDIASMPKDFKVYYNNLNESFRGQFPDSSQDFSLGDDATLTGTNYNGDGPTKSSGFRFGTVEVREYNRTVGDHPDVSDDGPPLTIAWDYVTTESIPVGQYESKKRKRRRKRLERRNQRLRLENKKQVKTIPNIEFTVPRLKGHVRRELLLVDYEIPLPELVQAELEVKRVSKEREESNAQTIFSEKTEELLESASRKIRRSFFFGYGRADKESQYHYRYGNPYQLNALQAKVLDRRQSRRSKASITPAMYSSSTKGNPPSNLQQQTYNFRGMG